MGAKENGLLAKSMNPAVTRINPNPVLSVQKQAKKKVKKAIIYNKSRSASESVRSINNNNPPALSKSLLRTLLLTLTHRDSGIDSRMNDLLLLLVHMRRNIPRIIVHMDISTLNRRHTLKHILQTLAQIMAIAQTHFVLQDDIDFDIQHIAGVVSAQVLDLEDRFGEPHRHVQQDADVFLGCCGPG